MSAAPPAPLERAAFSVLESQNDAIDLALWQVLRDVLLWARTPTDFRLRLFRVPGDVVRERIQAAGDAAPLLVDPLAVLTRVRLLPGQVAPERIAAACQLVTDWAERSGLHAIATHFAEASAYVEPENPQWAVRAGYITRAAGGTEMLGRSEAWHLRAYTLAVQQRNEEVALRSLTSAGALMKDKGEYGRARRFYHRAARRAKRSGRKRQAAVALHYSFALAAETGHLRIAVRDANGALRYYPLHDERIPALAHDVAFLLVQNHHHGTALRLVEGLAERAAGVSIIGALYGITARAAAGAGHSSSYDLASGAALHVARINEECAGAVFVNLAEAARFLGHWEMAAGHAGRALAVAQRRVDREIERLATQLQRQIKRREPPPPAFEPPSDTPIAALARRLAARLRQWRRYNRGVGTKV
jgi:hypothetical protein